MSSTSGDVVADEVYPTPASAVQALMNIMDFRVGDTFLEPCRGDMVDELGKQLSNIFTLTPVPESDKEWCEIREGREFLGHDFGERKFDVIITNPPFSLSCEFLEKCQSLLAHDGTLIFLQRVNWIGSKKRVPWWAKVGFPDKTPVLVPRPKFNPNKKGTDSCEYCWFAWDPGNRLNAPNGFSHIIAHGYKI